VIDERAIIHPSASLASSVSVGPWSWIGPDVTIDEGTHIGPHVVVKGPTRIGRNNRIYPFASVGDDPQDKKFKADEVTWLEIGHGNTIREYVTINRGTDLGGVITRIGDDNWIMAYCHVAHDCQVGSHTIFSNNASIAGHVTVEDHVIVSGFVGVHQFCRIGAYSFVAAYSTISKDVPPYMLVAGQPVKPVGLNREGLKRHDFSQDEIELLRNAYRILYNKAETVEAALEQLEAMQDQSAHVHKLIDFVRQSQRGIVR
jgi:UDP-N-acetylglucosamine acyltransferase